MNSKIIIVKDQHNAFWVSGRSLCLFMLKDAVAASNFLKWIASRTRAFQESEDFVIVDSKAVNLAATKGSKDYLLTLKLALFIARKDTNQPAIDLIQEKQAELTNTGVIANANLLGHTATGSIQVGTPSFIVGNSTDISITQVADFGMAVRARSLFNVIALPSVKKTSTRDMFYDWFNSRIKKYDLVTGVDYLSLPKSVKIEGGAQASMDAWISVKTAKLFAKIQQAGRGREAFEAIVKDEEALKKQHTKPSSTTPPTEPELPFSSESSVPPASHHIDSATTTDFRQPDEVASIVETESTQAQNTAGTVGQMPVLVSKSRSQVLMEQQRQLQEELEKTLREEEEEQKKSAEVPATPEQLADVIGRLNIADQRINAMEQWVRSFIGLMQQGATLLAGELPVGTETVATDQQSADPFQDADFSAEPVNIENELMYTPRRKLVQLVADYAEAKHHPFKDVWRYLYSQLHTVHRFNVSRKNGKENYLDYAERSGQIENLLAIAQSTLRPIASGAQA